MATTEKQQLPHDKKTTAKTIAMGTNVRRKEIIILTGTLHNGRYVTEKDVIFKRETIMFSENYCDIFVQKFITWHNS